MLSEATSWKEKIGDIDLIELYINTVEMLRLDFSWADETLETLQRYLLSPIIRLNNDQLPSAGSLANRITKNQLIDMKS